MDQSETTNARDLKLFGVFWVMMPYSLESGYQNLGGTYQLNIHGRPPTTSPPQTIATAMFAETENLNTF
jgi:hypothetical protein